MRQRSRNSNVSPSIVSKHTVADLTLGTGFHGKPYFFCTFTQVPTFYRLFGKIWPSWIRNKSYFWKKVFFGEVMTERENRILRIQYMATWCDGTFDVNMTSSKVVRTRHNIRRCLRRSLVLKIKPNTGQMLGNSDKIERRKNMASLRDPILTVTLKIFSKSEKAHNGGQTWHIFA